MVKKIKQEKTINDIFNQYWHSGIEYDYDRTQCSGNCDYICRCTEIYNTRVTEVDLNYLVDDFSEILGKDVITKYCIDRILTATKLYEPDNWEVRVSRGYYGDETNGAYPVSYRDSENWLEKLKILKTDNEKILLVLECEYGYILNQLKNITNFTIENIDKNDLQIGNLDHYKKLESDIVEKYKEYEYPRGICIKNDGGYKLIDGYHRVAACNSDKITMIVGSHNKGE